MIVYALEIRLTTATERMKYTSMTLEQIAENCGFETYPYFHKVFCKKNVEAPGVDLSFLVIKKEGKSMRKFPLFTSLIVF
jgi:transcriptional regulator GlxA family with amidase domain